MISYIVASVVILALTLWAARVREGSNSTHVRKRDAVCVSLFVVFWIFPISYVGITEKSLRGLPGPVTVFHSIACLFVREIDKWHSIHIQARFERNDPWVTLSDSLFTQINVWGYRTRFTRYFTRIDQRTQQAELQELAAWIRQRYGELHPRQPLPNSIRFLLTWQEASLDIRPSGHWKKHDPATQTSEFKQVFSTHEFETGQIRPKKAKGKTPS